MMSGLNSQASMNKAIKAQIIWTDVSRTICFSQMEGPFLPFNQNQMLNERNNIARTRVKMNSFLVFRLLALLPSCRSSLSPAEFDLSASPSWSAAGTGTPPRARMTPRMAKTRLPGEGLVSFRFVRTISYVRKYPGLVKRCCALKRAVEYKTNDLERQILRRIRKEALRCHQRMHCLACS